MALDTQVLSLQAALKRRDPHYAVVGWYPNGGNDVRLLSSKGKVIVFDSPVHARDIMTKLSDGRLATWKRGDVVTFSPALPNSINKACIVTDYDPYMLPACAPVSSETPLKPWKHHVSSWHVFYDCGQLTEDKDGTVTNLALE